MDDITPARPEAGPSGVTPPTNRGSHTPQSRGITSGPHWFTLTSWLPLDYVLQGVRAVLERVNEEDDFRQIGPVSRWAEIHECILPGLQVRKPHVGDYVSIEIKGRWCEILGISRIQQLMRWLSSERWHATRIDYAWDGFPFSPGEVRRLLLGRHYRSKADLSNPEFRSNAEGDTTYSRPLKGCGNVERFFRVYDRRGPVRMELQLSGQASRQLSHELLELPPHFWAKRCLGYLSGLVELLDPADASSRLDRRRPHPAWVEFCDNAVKVKVERPDNLVPKVWEDEWAEPLTRSQSVLDRAWQLQALVEAFGADYVLGELSRRFSASERVERLAAELKRIRTPAAAHGFCNVPPWPDGDDPPPF